MSRFFVNRPIVAMVISIIMVILGVVAITRLPVAQFPNIAPPEIQLTANYVGADALTVEESVATPIEQQMSGVDGSIYMYSNNANNGQMTLRVDFDNGTDVNTDQILTQMRYSQAASQLPLAVQNYGVTIRPSATSPLGLFSIYSPKGTYDALFLTNYAYINVNDPMTRVPGVAQVQIFGTGQYAMRLWVRPDTLAKLGVTTAEVLDAINVQNTVNPAGQIGGEPIPAGHSILGRANVILAPHVASVSAAAVHRAAGRFAEAQLRLDEAAALVVAPSATAELVSKERRACVDAETLSQSDTRPRPP